MKLFSKFILALFAALFSGVMLSAGESAANDGITVTVKVTDKSGAMPGAAVQVKGTTDGEITGSDGTATLTGVSPDAVLVVSFVGYQTVEIPEIGRAHV